MQVDVKSQHIFPRLIFKSHYDGFDPAVLVPVCEGLIKTALSKDNSYLEEGDAQSSVMYRAGAPHTLAVFKPFYDWLLPQIEAIMFQEWHLASHIDYWIQDSWVNRHGPGGKTAVHNHGLATMAISAYITMPENSGRIEFKDPCDIQWNFYFRSREPGTYYPVDITQGDVLMFPGWIDHRTEEHNGKPGEDRWVLTTNVMCHSMSSKDGTLLSKRKN
jgi:hypothetical protein